MSIMDNRPTKIKSKGNVAYDESKLDSMEQVVEEIRTDLKDIPIDIDLGLLKKIDRFVQSNLNYSEKHLPKELILLGVKCLDPKWGDTDQKTEYEFLEMCREYPELKKLFEESPGVFLTDPREMVRTLGKFFDEDIKDE